jgi:hypothetical protein
MIEIPQFTADELKGIIHLFGQNGVPLDYTGVTTHFGGHGGVTEFRLLVEEEDLVQSLTLLMDHFGIAPEVAELYEGLCPACETVVNGAVECPDCGLSLSVGTPESMRRHPFYAFLKSKGVLPNAAAET